MVKEKKPVGLPLPQNFKPADSLPVTVGGYFGGSPNDTWETVAIQQNMNAKDLVRFNFHTNDPDIVNWYLRRNVGCKIASPSGLNWTFRNANPGIIYVPLKTIDFDDAHGVTGTKGLGIDFEKQGGTLFDVSGWQLIGKILDIVAIADMGAAVLQIGLPLALNALSAFGGPALSFVQSMLALGMPHLEALAATKRNQAIWGISYGIVLGAQGAAPDFVKALGFNKRPVNNAVYPEQETNFQTAYEAGLAAGFAAGRKMNLVEKKALAQKLAPYIDAKKFPEERSKWTVMDWRNYYTDCAAAFRKYMIKL